MTYQQLEDEIIAEFDDAHFLRGSMRGDLDYISSTQRQNIKSFLRTALRRVKEATADALTGKRKH